MGREHRQDTGQLPRKPTNLEHRLFTRRFDADDGRFARDTQFKSSEAAIVIHVERADHRIGRRFNHYRSGGNRQAKPRQTHQCIDDRLVERRLEIRRGCE